MDSAMVTLSMFVLPFDLWHYAKKLLELNHKVFLKPSDIKTCFEKPLESFQQVYLNFF